MVLTIINHLFFCPAHAEATADAERQYHDLTKQILLLEIGIERFTLNYRLAAGQQPSSRRLRYFMSQEAGAAGAMVFDIVTADQFDKGRKDPENIDTHAIRGGLQTALITSIIAGSGSALELASNSILALRHKNQGYSSRQATAHMASQFRILDDLLVKRDALVDANKDHPAYSAAMLEGKILRDMRNESLYEFGKFTEDTTDFRTSENLFFALNIPTNVALAVSAGLGMRGIADTRFNGPANILFVVGGAFTTASPVLSMLGGKLAARISSNRLDKLAKQGTCDTAELSVNAKRLKEALQRIDPTGTKYPLAVWRAGEYTAEVGPFNRELRNEDRLRKYLGQVAIQSNIIGPPIGGTVLTQGILGTIGHYQYDKTTKEFDLNHKGSVIGLAGAGTAVGATAAGFLADSYYFYRMKQKNRLPRQIIGERLKFLDDVEIKVKAL